jgi:hypothetical protein
VYLGVCVCVCEWGGGAAKASEGVLLEEQTHKGIDTGMQRHRDKTVFAMICLPVVNTGRHSYCPHVPCHQAAAEASRNAGQVPSLYLMHVSPPPPAQPLPTPPKHTQLALMTHLKLCAGACVCSFSSASHTS